MKAPATPSSPDETAAPEGQLPAAALANAVAAPAEPVAARPADPDDAVETAKTPTLMERVQAFRAKNELAEIALFFFLGFVYDVASLSRIDDTLTIVQQFAYLAVLAGLLLLEQRYGEGSEPPKWLAKVWRFREDALHFLFGSLMSTFTLFFFKSASGVTALIFLVTMFGLMVANELPRFRALGPVVRVGLFSLCVTAYFGYVLPVLLGRMGFWVFLLAVVLGSASLFGMIHVLRKWRADEAALRWRVAVPGFGVQGALLLLYVLKVIPPVPLAVQYSGIYHDVKGEKTAYGREYHLSHERKWWKFWQRGDQDFLAREGDKAWYFFSVFAPKGFEQYKLRVRWYRDDPQKGWTEHGSGTPLSIANSGNEWGFRSYAYASNPRPGDWRAVLETDDGHEINRMSFSVEADTRAEPPSFQVDVSAPRKLSIVSREKLEKERAEEKAAQEKAAAEKAQKK
ncbi:DUF2914 domain-containing protein [Myxococcaceae bacterium GXIMD 01537]